MSIIGAIIGVVFTSFLAQPDWFDSGPYESVAEHKTVQHCQLATYGTEDICTTSSAKPSIQYTKIDVVMEPDLTVKELTFVDCDYWAGCYNKG